MTRNPWGRQTPTTDEERERAGARQLREQTAKRFPPPSKQELRRIAAKSKVTPQVLPPGRRVDQPSEEDKGS